MFKKVLFFEFIAIIAGLLMHANIHNIRVIDGFIPAPDTIITVDGHIWNYDGLPGYGCFTRVFFDSNATPDLITDDIIIKITRSGLQGPAHAGRDLLPAGSAAACRDRLTPAGTCSGGRPGSIISFDNF